MSIYSENQEEANSQEQTHATSANQAVASTSTVESTPLRKTTRVVTIQKKQEQLLVMASAVLNYKQDQWEMMGQRYAANWMHSNKQWFPNAILYYKLTYPRYS